MLREDLRTKSQPPSMNWFLVLWYIHLHFLGIVALWVLFADAQWMTVLFGTFLTLISCIGVTVGMHRYYAHQSFRASTPLRFFFVLAHTLAGVGPMRNWILLHRMHHKYFGTDKDPYNYNNGFLYSHFISNSMEGYLENTELVKAIDMRDVEMHKLLWVQQKFYWVFFVFLTVFLPIYIPIGYWNESFQTSILILGILRLAISFNIAALVNSAILIWGLKPTDKFPVDDFSVFWLTKSYWPNYHYIFPRDWKSSEFGKYDTGCGTLLIKFWYEMGLVDTLVTMSSEHVREVLYEMACKKISLEGVMEKLEQLSTREAIQENLRFQH